MSLADGNIGRAPIGWHCESCDRPQSTLDVHSRLDTDMVCARCYWTKGCTDCHKHYAIPGQEQCEACLVAFYVRNLDEFRDAVNLPLDLVRKVRLAHYQKLEKELT